MADKKEDKKEKDAEEKEDKGKKKDKGKEEDGDAAEEGAEGEKKGLKALLSGKKLIILIAVAVLVLGGAGGGAWYFFKHKKAAEATTEEQAAAPAESAEAKPEEAKSEEHGKEGEKGKEGAKAPIPGQPIYYNLPEILVNLNTSGNKQTTLLKVSVALELAKSSDLPMVEANLPRIQDSFNTYLREMRASDLSGSAGVYRLREELMLRINKIISPAKVNDILFRSILVQ